MPSEDGTLVEWHSKDNLRCVHNISSIYCTYTSLLSTTKVYQGQREGKRCSQKDLKNRKTKYNNGWTRRKEITSQRKENKVQGRMFGRK
jgi:hypothetical protein